MSNYLRLKKMLYIVVLATIAIVLGLIELPVILPWLKLDLSEVVILVAVIVLGYKGALSVVFLRAAGRRIFKLIAPFLNIGLVEDPIMGLIGEMIAIIASLIIILTYYLVSKAIKTHRKPLIMAIDVEPPKTTLKELIMVTFFITFALSVVLVSFNFLIGTPLYLSYYGHVYFGVLDRVYLTSFGFVSDPGLQQAIQSISDAWYLDEPIFSANLRSFFIYNVVSYVPFNIGKGLLTSLVFLAIKPRIQRMEL